MDKHVLSVSTTNNSAQFNTIPSDDFPSVVGVGKLKPLLKVSKEDMLLAIGRVLFSAASDDVKPVLTGIRVEIKGDTLSFVSADALRLSKQSVKLSGKVSDEMNLLVPSKAMGELAHVLTEVEGDDDIVELYVIEDKNQVLFRFGDIDIVSRLIDGQFPEYQQIIPTGFKTRSVFNRSDFANSLKVTNIIARSVIGNKMILDLDSKKNTITMSATQSDVGSNESVVEVEMEGDATKMAFSGRFLSDMLNNIGGEDIEFECSEPTKPGVFKVKEDDSFIHLIMPMML
jgi:DNA polymerase-3 subunit beta